MRDASQSITNPRVILNPSAAPRINSVKNLGGRGVPPPDVSAPGLVQHGIRWCLDSHDSGERPVAHES